jgi:hypothetical protein
MNTNTSVKVTYWAIPTGSESMSDLEGINEFRKELEKDYVTSVHGRRTDALGGGCYDLVIELISNVSISDVAAWLMSGVAFDVLKHGSNSLILRPLLSAYQKLKERNTEHDVSIEELRIIFRDATLVIYNVGDLFKNIEGILKAVAQHYSKTASRSGEMPYEIHIPIVEDTTADRLTRFRVLLDVDETVIPAIPAVYYKYWGLRFDIACQTRVFDVSGDLRIDEEFFTKERYSAEWDYRAARKSFESENK